ncbi:MAG: hypothetical protein ACD_13C00244G0001, partial [uncultured bacterium]
EFADARETLIDETLKRLEKNNLVNDQEFARWFVAQRLQFKPKGKKVLGLELRQKGIDPATVKDVLADDQLYSADQEREVAYLIARKALRQLQGLINHDRTDQLTIKRRLYQRLASRGFPFELVKSVVDDLLSLK